jgi:hypothetical protein
VVQHTNAGAHLLKYECFFFFEVIQANHLNENIDGLHRLPQIMTGRGNEIYLATLAADPLDASFSKTRSSEKCFISKPQGN